MNIENELAGIYANRFNEELEYRERVWNVLVSDFFSQYVDKSATVLDLGCGYGQFINTIRCARKYAMDLNPEAPKYLAGNVEFLQQDCSAQWPLANDSLDVVFTSNFFEHLPSKEALTRTLAEARRCLKPGGRLIAMGPNIKYTGGAYWDFYDHYLALTELSMKEVLELVGFSTERVCSRFLPYTMVGAPRYPMFFLQLYLRLPFVWRFFGGQFLVTAISK